MAQYCQKYALYREMLQIKVVEPLYLVQKSQWALMSTSSRSGAGWAPKIIIIEIL